jgi:hypothetical protein
MEPNASATLEELADATAVELGALPHADAHRQFCELHESAPDLACEVGDRDPELHRKLARPPKSERVHGAQRIACERRAGRRAVTEVEVRDRRNAHRARRLHPTATVTTSPARARSGRAARPATNPRRSGSRRPGSGSRAGPDDPDDPEPGRAGQEHDGEEGSAESRTCAAPWCKRPLVGSSRKRFCATEWCARARAAERQRQSRAARMPLTLLPSRDGSSS